jgi:hypothetical protein
MGVSGGSQRPRECGAELKLFLSFVDASPSIQENLVRQFREPTVSAIEVKSMKASKIATVSHWALAGLCAGLLMIVPPGFAQTLPDGDLDAVPDAEDNLRSAGRYACKASAPNRRSL